MKKLLFLFLFLINMHSVHAETSIKEVSFVRCVDGDTAVFKVDEEEIKFRFLAIDTPETVHPTVEVEAFGKNASEYTCNKLSKAQEIVVEYEESNKIDKYDRHLAWIWVDGSLLQKELVSVGYAEVAYIYGDYRYTESLCLIQKDARELSLGLWLDTKEEGYCSTVDLTNVVDNIIYENIESPEEVLSEEDQKWYDTLENASGTAQKFMEYSDKNQEKITKIYFYLMMGAAILSIIYKSIKNR